MTTKETEPPYDVAASNERENAYWSQVHFPQLWACTRCEIRRDHPRAKQACVALGDSPYHAWEHTAPSKETACSK